MKEAQRKPSAFSRIVRGTIWTLSLVAVLFAIDRGFFGPVEPSGWQYARRLEEVPRSAGQLVFPAYLPQDLSWPPSRVFHREKPSPGWWIGLTSAVLRGEVALWIGSGSLPLPPEFAGLSSCFNDRVRCPEGWRIFSSEVEGTPVYLLTRIEPAAAAQILTELKRMR